MFFFGCFRKVGEDATNKALYKELDDNGNIAADGKEFSIQDSSIITGIDGKQAQRVNENARGMIIFYRKGKQFERDVFITVCELGNYVTYCQCYDCALCAALESYAQNIKEEEEDY